MRNLKNLSGISDLIKLQPKYLIGISIATGVLLFGTDTVVLKGIGLVEFTDKYRVWIGVTFLIVTSLLVAHFVDDIRKLISGKRTERQVLAYGKKYLKALTPDEKKILKKYIEENTKTQNLNYTDGTVQELNNANIIYMSSSLSKFHTIFPFNIQPWAWEYLNKNKHLVEVAGDYDAYRDYS
jgi:hypothetical protein